MKCAVLICMLFVRLGCFKPASEPVKESTQDTAYSVPDTQPIKYDTPANVPPVFDTLIPDNPSAFKINTADVKPDELLAFAKTLNGIPYKYASTDPTAGFDCSGFITYVFKHFDILVPRSSIDFTDVGKQVNLLLAKPGDLILFTGTDSTIRNVGHMGIIISNVNGEIEFIHSTSGKAYGVTVTPLNSYYMGRFVKVIRIFPENEI